LLYNFTAKYCIFSKKKYCKILHFYQKILLNIAKYYKILKITARYCIFSKKKYCKILYSFQEILLIIAKYYKSLQILQVFKNILQKDRNMLKPD
jgi:hypothetical protein